VVNSPRLLYPPGVGIVILWGGFLAVLAVGDRRPQLRAAVAALLILLILGMSGRFVRERNEQYLLAQEPVLQLVEIAKESDPQEELIVVNFPSWLSPQERRFAMGNHGVQIIPFYINIRELIYAHNDAEQAAQAIQFGNIRQPMPYYYGMLGEQVDYEKLGDKLLGGGPVYLTQWAPEQIKLRKVGRAGGRLLDPQQEVFTFNDEVRLQPLSISTGEALDEGLLSLKLLWEIKNPVDDDVTVFVHLYGPGGELIDQADGYPIAGMAPFWLWPAGQTLEDFRSLTLPPGTNLDALTVGIGLYKSSTGERLPVVDKNGQALPNDVILLPPSA
jgi:hypothetical protein